LDKLLAGFLTLTLFMTLSRGAIYALSVGLIVLVAVNFRKIKQNLVIISIVAAGFLVSLTAQGTMVALNQNVGESFSFGVAKSLHHLSLGVIDFRDSARNIELPVAVETNQAPQEVYFDGYVAESTEARLSFNELAYDAWKSSPLTAIFGVGLGGAGVAMHQTHPEQIGSLEITQNEYTEIPLELGLVGFSLFLILIVGFFRKTASTKWPWAVAAAYLIQWAFFSGYPNAFHIYLVLFLLYKINCEKINFC
jgi:O-antigen ligase